METTDTTRTTDTETAADTPEEKQETAAAETSAEAAADLEVVDDTDYEVIGDDEDEGTAPAAPSAKSAIITGAAAVAGAALALSSLTGTWLSNVVSQRQGLIGQIKTSSGTAKQQIAAGYGTPWHAIALVNGIFAVVALLVCGGVLLHPASRARAARGHWSQALAWGGTVLAVIGLLIAGAMWFDVFADLPTVPAS
ncbi:hypothetical protein SAMN05216251_11860 [Actinacidiphila alni]|uniref:Uncharacterized protein n=1 Tax=Actinacidiphila alni TaxID=380248 RepID=A0A1I2JK86_9ACTN|nr:hypothetical protein [Actinacidiphila alni]SFF54380.1 hypothetical protein SAMN05216251_11860 [Actinacidiphila alni]